MGKDFAALMEDQVPVSIPVSMPVTSRITPEQLEQLKAMARERAIQSTLEQQSQGQGIEAQTPAPSGTTKIVYVRRNFTVAELIVIFALSCGLVLGVQTVFTAASNWLPRLEIKVK